MKLESDALLLPQAAAGTWRAALPAVLVALVAILALYWTTAESMVATWLHSTAFNHGLLIAPISLTLVWRKRYELAALSPRADYLGFVLLAMAASAWLAGAAGQVLVVEQYALVAMIPAAVVAIAGRQVAWTIAFPLAFLFFAVPAGDAFVPPLMNWTADATVSALRLTGIPVYREGNLFSIPTGQWSVVEACSGLRYLIASVTVGALFAHLNYRRFWKRALFVALAVAVPIAANFGRAYLIVMIGHLSHMRIGLGIEHMLFGWVFFGAVILALFWLASFWRDAPQAELARTSAWHRPQSARAMAAAAAGVLALAAAAPAYAAYLDRAVAPAAAIQPPALSAKAGWVLDESSLTGWRPHYVGAAASSFSAYRKGERAVAVYMASYRNQRQGAELVSWQNGVLSPDEPRWAKIGQGSRGVALGARTLEVHETRLRSAPQRLVVWEWFRLPGADTASRYVAKALLARDRLLGRGDDSAVIVLAAPYAERPDEAVRTLADFARDMLP